MRLDLAQDLVGGEGCVYLGMRGCLPCRGNKVGYAVLGGQGKMGPITPTLSRSESLVNVTKMLVSPVLTFCRNQTLVTIHHSNSLIWLSPH